MDCVRCEAKDGMVDRIVVGISLTGDLSEEQKSRLLEIANKCPVHRTLVSKVQIEANLVEADAHP
jgi:putative redox protein